MKKQRKCLTLPVKTSQRKRHIPVNRIVKGRKKGKKKGRKKSRLCQGKKGSNRSGI